MVIRHDSTSSIESQYCVICDFEVHCTGQDGSARSVIVHGVLLPILYELLQLQQAASNGSHGGSHL